MMSSALCTVSCAIGFQSLSTGIILDIYLLDSQDLKKGNLKKAKLTNGKPLLGKINIVKLYGHSNQGLTYRNSM